MKIGIGKNRVDLRNISRHPFERGIYIGLFNGCWSWRIRKSGPFWEATNENANPRLIREYSLAEISAHLNDINARESGKQGG